MISQKKISKRFKSLRSWSISPLIWCEYQILRRLPYSVRKKIIFLVVSLYFWFYQKPKIQKNIRLIRSDLDSDQIGREIERLKKTITENFATVLGNGSINIEKEMERLEVTGELDRVLDLYRKGTKIIITVTHTATYDKAFCFVPFVNRKLAPLELRVYVPAERILLVDNIMAAWRKNFGDIIFEPVKKGGETLAKSKKNLNEGRVVLLPIDILRKDNSGVLCRIGNGEARFPVGAVKLALEEDAILIPLFPSSGQDGKVQIRVGFPFNLAKTGDIKKDIENNVRRLIEEVYAPFIQQHYYEWLQLPWSDLKPSKKA